MVVSSSVEKRSFESIVDTSVIYSPDVRSELKARWFEFELLSRK